MNKTELRKIAREIIKERFEMFTNVKVIELECGRSTVDEMLFLNYLVIVNSTVLYKLHISEDEWCGHTDVFVKECMMSEDTHFTGLFSTTTCKQIY